MDKKIKVNPIRKVGRVLHDNISFRLTGKRGRILSLAVTAFIIIFLIVKRDLYFTEDNSYAGILFTFSILGALLAGALIAFKMVFRERRRLFFSTILFFLLPFASMQMVESFNGKFIYNFSVPTFLLNYTFYLFFYLVFYLITQRYHLSTIITNTILYVFGIVNYFVDLFRGTPFVPMDILSIKTGMNVADGYEFGLSWQLILASLVFVLIYLLNRHLPDARPKERRFRLLARLFAAAYLVIMLCLVFLTSLLPDHGYKPDFWDQSRGYHRTGTVLNFCLNLKYLVVSQPEGYDADSIYSLVDETLAEYGVDIDGDTSINLLTGENDYTASEEQPNIICIMNESWSDLAEIGDLETNEDYMPFIHSLTENTVKGSLQVPVFGAGTSNTEFEFLTGDSVSFLPSGSNAYQSYIKTDLPSLTTTLMDQGYSSIAFHPYYASGWNRTNVYNYMGFSSFISIESFIDEDILETYKENNDAIEYAQLLEDAYPGEDMLLRRFISDSYDYEMIIDMYEESDEDTPFYIFNVTMQNHGGYTVSYPNFDESIRAVNMSTVYPKANRYLSLIKETDSAFQELVEYFSTVDEPTIICMFGDHQPSIEDAFYEELYGTDLESLDEEQTHSRYETPFIIWANYDIPEEDDIQISSNYLSTLVLQLAGSELTSFNKYLAALYQEIPVMDAAGYITSDGEYFSYDDDTEYSDDILRYQQIGYNYIIDTDSRVEELFTLTD